MITPLPFLVRPQTFENGNEYIWKDKSQNIYHSVKFVCYYPCPAFVVVATQDGKRLRLPRDEIFAHCNSQHNIFSARKTGLKQKV